MSEVFMPTRCFYPKQKVQVYMAENTWLKGEIVRIGDKSITVKLSEAWRGWKVGSQVCVNKYEVRTS